MNLSNYLKPASAIISAIFLASQPINAEITYRLVTDNDMIIDRCVYIMVAEDLDIAASKEMNSPNGIKTTTIARNGNEIRLPDSHDVGEFALRYRPHTDCTCGDKSRHVDYIWGFQHTVKEDYLTYFFRDGLQLDWQVIEPNRIFHHNATVLIDPQTQTCTTSFFLDGQERYGIWFKDESGNYIANTYAPETEGLHKLQLYRKEIYDLRVLSMTKTDEGYEIRIHINQFDDGSPYSKGDLMYIFSDEEFLYNDEIYHHDEAVKLKNYNDGNLTINYKGNKKYLWLIRDHGPIYIQTDAIKVELKETSLPPTSAESEHFTHPATEGYHVGDAIDFEPKDNDVKIYYTLDGQDPIIPTDSPASVTECSVDGEETEEHAGKTYDLDERALIYTGTPLSVRYVAIKSGFSPSTVNSLSIAGLPTSIDLIGCDGKQNEPQYFNIHGMRVSQPLAPGIYILKHDGKTEKIIIR